jgi:hypothetical protein
VRLPGGADEPKKQKMSAVIIYPKAEDYMLKYGFFGGGVLQVVVREV